MVESWGTKGVSQLDTSSGQTGALARYLAAPPGQWRGEGEP
jgi:hypothetical protein